MVDRTESNQSEQQIGGTATKEQASYDRSFFEQMGGPTGVVPSSLGLDITSQVVASYFESIEAQTRQARRMADLWAQSLILQQTTSEVARVIAPAVTKQVLDHLRSNPSLLKELNGR